MTKRYLAAGLFALAAAALPCAFAQEGPAARQPEQVQQRLQQIRERLQLTPEQVEQVRPVIVEEMQQLKAVREKYGTGDQNLRARRKAGREMRGIRNAADEKLRKILSKQQMDELKKIRDERRREFRERSTRR